jgi:hypothetical protein
MSEDTQFMSKPVARNLKPLALYMHLWHYVEYKTVKESVLLVVALLE